MTEEEVLLESTEGNSSGEGGILGTGWDEGDMGTRLISLCYC